METTLRRIYKIKYKQGKSNYVADALSQIKLEDTPREMNILTKTFTTALEDDLLSILNNVDEILDIDEIPDVDEMSLKVVLEMLDPETVTEEEDFEIQIPYAIINKIKTKKRNNTYCPRKHYTRNFIYRKVY